MKFKKMLLIASLFLTVSFRISSVLAIIPKEPSLKNTFKNKFYIGTALNESQIKGLDNNAITLLKKHFNSIVAENCMKSSILQSKEGVFNFAEADKFVELGEKYRMLIIGHTLIWHSQAPKWFFVDENGKNVSKEMLIDRMRKHITTVVTRYKGKIHGWDVVNEAFEDDGSYRRSKFYEILGEDYIELAFKFAREADPKAELYYNDYNLANPKKRNAVVNMVKKLQSKAIRIDAIGMQGHLTMQYPNVDSFEKSIIAFSQLGIQVMITELDLTVLPFPSKNISAEVSLSYEYKKEMNPYAQGMPKEIEEKFEQRYMDFFSLFLKHHDKISRITLWGISDKNSWKNDWPISGRTDYPLLFDRNYKPKRVINKIIALSKNDFSI